MIGARWRLETYRRSRGKVSFSEEMTNIMSSRMLKLVCVAVAILLVNQTPLLAALGDDKGASAFYGRSIGAGLGAAFTIIGAGLGFGRIGSAALESMARQPETAARIQTAMIIIGALLEGVTFLALIVCILLIVL